VSDRVTHPVEELTILVVGDLRIVHEKAIDGNGLRTLDKCSGDVLVTVSDVGGSWWYVYHAVGLYAFPVRAIKCSNEFTGFAASTAGEREGHKRCGQEEIYKILH
jgi:hypothetical protein